MWGGHSCPPPEARMESRADAASCVSTLDFGLQSGEGGEFHSPPPACRLLPLSCVGLTCPAGRGECRGDPAGCRACRCLSANWRLRQHRSPGRVGLSLARRVEAAEESLLVIGRRRGVRAAAGGAQRLHSTRFPNVLRSGLRRQCGCPGVDLSGPAKGRWRRSCRPNARTEARQINTHHASSHNGGKFAKRRRRRMRMPDLAWVSVTRRRNDSVGFAGTQIQPPVIEGPRRIVLGRGGSKLLHKLFA